MSACTDGQSTIRLREMKRADMPAIISLERELFPEDMTDQTEEEDTE